MRRSTERPDPDKHYVAWQTVCIAELEPAGILRRGDRYPGDHPLVRARPEFFIQDGERLEERMRQKLAESVGAAKATVA